MTKKTLTDKQIYGKVLASDELISYIFDKRLPPDMELRLERWRKENCKTTEPTLKSQLNAMKQGLTTDQLKPGLQWERLALVLPIKKCHCTGCNSYYEGPCGPVMVKAHHELLGTHWKKPEEGLNLEDLPKEFIFIHEDIAVCPNCFIEREEQLPKLMEVTTHDKG